MAACLVQDTFAYFYHGTFKTHQELIRCFVFVFFFLPNQISGVEHVKVTCMSVMIDLSERNYRNGLNALIHN